MLSAWACRKWMIVIISGVFLCAERRTAHDYEQYEQYLFKMRQVIIRAHRVLNDGRFFVMNTAPVLLRRASRSESSHCRAVRFAPHIY